MKRRTRRTGTRKAFGRTWVEEWEELEALSAATPCIAGRGRLFVLRGDGRGRRRPDAPEVSPSEFRRKLRELGLSLYRVNFDPAWIRVGRRPGVLLYPRDIAISPDGDSIPLR